jgi:NAD(P)H-flavin reductase
MAKLSSQQLSTSPLSTFLAPTACKVAQIKVESHDTVTLIINPPTGYQVWHPGQFNMLYLFGLGEVPISISGDESEPKCLSHTVKAVGPVSRALTKLSAGDTVWLRGPYGSSWPDVPNDFDLLIVAGGIGLAPLRPVVLSNLRNTSRGKIILLYGTRTPRDVLFADDLIAWSKQPETVVQATVDRIDQGSQANPAPWQGSVGVVTHLLTQLDLNPQKTTVMACGPEVMLRHVAADLGSMGILDRHIFVSLERNMKCAIGLCGRCQWGPHFVCRDGPVYQLADIRKFWSVKEF